MTHACNLRGAAAQHSLGAIKRIKQERTFGKRNTVVAHNDVFLPFLTFAKLPGRQRYRHGVQERRSALSKAEGAFRQDTLQAAKVVATQQNRWLVPGQQVQSATSVWQYSVFMACVSSGAFSDRVSADIGLRLLKCLLNVAQYVCLVGMTAGVSALVALS